MAPQALDIMAVWILLGTGLGFLSTVYGACRRVYRMACGVGHFLDWLWFVVAAMAFLIVSLWTEWGVFRIWSIVLVLVGYGLWSWLAAPLVLALVSAVTYGQARLIYYVTWPFRRAVRWIQRRPILFQKKPPAKG